MKKKLLKNMEWSILIVCVILTIIGLFALFSATQSKDYEEFRKQIKWIIISIPFLILAITIDYNAIVKFSTLAYLIELGLLIGVLFTKPISGATSWYKFGNSFSFQPSELGKVIVVLFLSLADSFFLAGNSPFKYFRIVGLIQLYLIGQPESLFQLPNLVIRKPNVST